MPSVRVHLCRATHVVDPVMRTLAGDSVDRAAAYLVQHDRDLPGYVEAFWRVEPSAPVAVERQQAAKLRRVRALALKAGRVVSRVESVPGFPYHYRALLAR